MRFIKIPKKHNKGFREIAIPSKKEKKELRELLPKLNELCWKYCDKNIVHGFMNYRSAVTNANVHIGKNFSLTIDLSNFFDTVRIEHISKYFDENQTIDFYDYSNGALAGKKLIKSYTKQDVLNKIFIKDNNGIFRAYQGLPTSPLVANLAAVDMDNDIKKYIIGKNIELDEEIVFSRYADDITFSFNNYNTYLILKNDIPQIIVKHNFIVNIKKIYLQSERFGRKITGVNVTGNKLKASSGIRRRIRALKFIIKKIDSKINVNETEIKLIDSALKDDWKHPMWAASLPDKDKLDFAAKIELGNEHKRGIQIKLKSLNKEKKRLEKQLNSLNAWALLRFPTQPIAHTKKILLSYFHYLNAKKLMEDKLEKYTDFYQNYTSKIKVISDTDSRNFSGSIKYLIKEFYSNKILTPAQIKHINDMIFKNEYINNMKKEILSDIIPSNDVTVKSEVEELVIKN